MAAQSPAQCIRQARQHWQSAADMMPQLICLLDGHGHLIHTNRTIERWGLGKVASAKGGHLHDVLHRGCVDPQCHISQLGLTSSAKWSRRAATGYDATEYEVFDPVLQRHLTVLLKSLVRPPPRSSETDDPHAVVIMSDVSVIRKAAAGYQRLYEALEGLACDETERPRVGAEMQARLLGILEKTTDYIAMSDAAGSMVYINPAGRAMLGVTPKDDISGMRLCEHSDQEVIDRIRNEAIPSAIREGLWTGESRFRDHSGREIDVSQVIIAHRGNNGQLENLSTIVRETTEQVQIAESLRDSRDELRRLSGLLVTIQEDERRRIAMDLHDGLGQSLSLIKLSIEGAARLLAAGATAEAGESLQELIPRAREAVAEVRRVSTELRPWILDDLGIVRTLAWFFREFEATRGDITVEQEINVAEHEVPVPLKITIFRILQEATNNIVKHAGADRVRVRLDRVDDVLTLLIEDNGCGFDPDSIPCLEGQCGGFGLLSMKERAALSGGHYQLVSSPGQDTCIRIWWPCVQLPG